MSLGAVSLANQELLQQAQRAAETSPQQLQDFRDVLASLDTPGQEAAPAALGDELAPLDVGKLDFKNLEIILPADAEGLYAEKVAQVKEPGGAERMLSDAQDKYSRLDQLIGELTSGRSFSPEELVGVQSEVHRISFELEATTKVMGEVVSGVKQMMQQQV